MGMVLGATVALVLEISLAVVVEMGIGINADRWARFGEMSSCAGITNHCLHIE